MRGNLAKTCLRSTTDIEMIPHTCPLIDHIKKHFVGQDIRMEPMWFNGAAIEDLASVLELLRITNTELRIEAERANDLEVEIVSLTDQLAEMEIEVSRLRRSL
jgi:hypothetical protein